VTTFTRGPHAFRWGGRLRGVSLKDQDTQNYTGSYTFSSLDSYRLTLLGLQKRSDASPYPRLGRRRQPVVPGGRQPAIHAESS